MLQFISIETYDRNKFAYLPKREPLDLLAQLLLTWMSMLANKTLNLNILLGRSPDFRKKQYIKIIAGATGTLDPWRNTVGSTILTVRPQRECCSGGKCCSTMKMLNPRHGPWSNCETYITQTLTSLLNRMNFWTSHLQTDGPAPDTVRRSGAQERRNDAMRREKWRGEDSKLNKIKRQENQR